MASANGSSSWLFHCMLSDSGLYNFLSITTIWLLLMVPLWILILATTLQRWRRVQRFVVSHSDYFTYHSLFFDLLTGCYHILISSASFQHNTMFLWISMLLTLLISPGPLLLHTVICIERYIAVVFPVLYLTLRQRRGIWVRNCVILGIWGVCWLFLVLYLFVIQEKYFPIPLWILLSFVTSVISFCCVQVLCALRNPSPGDGQGLSRSRRRAFFTMVIILSCHWLWLTAAIGSVIISNNVIPASDVLCTFSKSMFSFQIPAGIVLPLLFLHRAGKLPKCFQRH